MIEDPIERAKAWMKEQEEKQLLLSENQIMKPKADYYDSILKNPTLLTTTQIAKDYGMAAKSFNELLHNLKVQYKQDTQWLLYYRYQNKGYVSSETLEIKKKDKTTFLKVYTKWTQKGRIFLYNLLKENGTLPLIERGI